jgi:transketolase
MVDTNQLREMARQIRMHALKAIHSAKSGHPGGSLSCADILAVLYGGTLNVRPEELHWQDRDRFILSKGHACPALYAALALRGYFSTDELVHLRKVYHFLEGHPCVETPGVDAPSGLLGMGLSQAIGMALASRRLRKEYYTYVVLGDGDMQEGCTLAALQYAGHSGLDNLVAILDWNKFQGDDYVSAQFGNTPFVQLVEALGWRAEKIDGHDISAVLRAFSNARTAKDAPYFIVAETVKGKGVSFMEKDPYKWHGSVTMTEDELARALDELSNGGSR